MNRSHTALVSPILNNALERARRVAVSTRSYPRYLARLAMICALLGGVTVIGSTGALASGASYAFPTGHSVSGSMTVVGAHGVKPDGGGFNSGNCGNTYIEVDSSGDYGIASV